MVRHAYRSIFVVVLAVVHGLMICWPEILVQFGVGKLEIWFRDTYAMLAASDFARAGFNPFVQNPYDLIGERHIYSDWWYGLSWVGLDRSDYLWVGWVVVVVFWLSVIWVLRLRTKRELIWSLLLCGSPPFWLGVNRANPDLVVFAVVTAAVWLMTWPKWGARQLAPLPIALATGLKFFPILAGAIFLVPAANRRDAIVRWSLIAVLGAFLCWSLRESVANYLEVGWLARGQFVFGAGSMPINFSVRDGLAILVGRVGGLLLVTYGLIRGKSLPVGKSDPHEFYAALAGASVLAGSFFLTTGFLYKIIFAVWLLPQLWALMDESSSAGNLARFALISLIGFAWLEGIVCGTSMFWLEWVNQGTSIWLRRLAAATSAILQWGFFVPVVMIFGANLRGAWQRPAENETQ